MSRVQLLTANGVTPWIVFDGGRLPIKGEEEEARRRWAGAPGGAGRPHGAAIGACLRQRPSNLACWRM